MLVAVSACRALVCRPGGVPEPALPQGPARTSVLQVMEALQPEAPEGSNPRARPDQNAGLGWLLREVELISAKMQEYVN